MKIISYVGKRNTNIEQLIIRTNGDPEYNIMYNPDFHDLNEPDLDDLCEYMRLQHQHAQKIYRQWGVASIGEHNMSILVTNREFNAHTIDNMPDYVFNQVINITSGCITHRNIFDEPVVPIISEYNCTYATMLKTTLFYKFIRRHRALDLMELLNLNPHSSYMIWNYWLQFNRLYVQYKELL
jgi:hypothetical protein